MVLIFTQRYVLTAADPMPTDQVSHVCGPSHACGLLKLFCLQTSPGIQYIYQDAPCKREQHVITSLYQFLLKSLHSEISQNL